MVAPVIMAGPVLLAAVQAANDSLKVLPLSANHQQDTLCLCLQLILQGLEKVWKNASKVWTHKLLMDKCWRAASGR